jgi:hypothetical protein
MLIIAEKEKAQSTTPWSEDLYVHCESSTDAPIKRDRTLFVVRSMEAPSSNRLSATESFCFFAFAENSD